MFSIMLHFSGIFISFGCPKRCLLVLTVVDEHGRLYCTVMSCPLRLTFRIDTEAMYQYRYHPYDTHQTLYNTYPVFCDVCAWCVSLVHLSLLSCRIMKEEDTILP